ncbi:hypothetical protein ACWCO3_18030 [Micromonospora sp. NPDC002411]
MVQELAGADARRAACEAAEADERNTLALNEEDDWDPGRER